MTQGQRNIEMPRCPRCGGPMMKPPGSNLYWHADYNHPRCDITNLVEASLTMQSNDESLHVTPKDDQRNT